MRLFRRDRTCPRPSIWLMMMEYLKMKQTQQTSWRRLALSIPLCVTLGILAGSAHSVKAEDKPAGDQVPLNVVWGAQRLSQLVGNPHGVLAVSASGSPTTLVYEPSIFLTM